MQGPGRCWPRGLELSATRKDVQAALLGNLGQAHQRLGRLDSALVSYQSAVALYRQSGFAAGEAQALGDLGAAYFMQGDPEQALSFLKQARDKHRRIGDPLGLARALDRIGTVYFVRGAADSARLAFVEALELYRYEEYLRGPSWRPDEYRQHPPRRRSARFGALLLFRRTGRPRAPSRRRGPRNPASADWTKSTSSRDDLEAALVAYREALSIHQARERRMAKPRRATAWRAFFFSKAVWIRRCPRTSRRLRSIGGMIVTRASGRRHWTTSAMCICTRVVWIRRCPPLKRHWRYTLPTAIRAAGPSSRARSVRYCKSRVS